MAELFGRYRLDELIGRGGMGEVYRAFDTVKQRTVALKRLPAHLANDSDFQARFRKESALAARLSEPHIIPIHDYGEINGQLFIDMRLVNGRDLASVLRDHGPLDPHRAVNIISQIAHALDAAHAEGLIHRDVKPSNILLGGAAGDEFAYLIDFGITRAVSGAGDTSITATGATVGTLDYMAPERFGDETVDHRADVYSLACVLFEALTARKPFDADELPRIIHAHLHIDPPRPSIHHPGVPLQLDTVIASGMAKYPWDRYASAGSLAVAASNALGTKQTLSSRVTQSVLAVRDHPALLATPPRTTISRNAPDPVPVDANRPTYRRTPHRRWLLALISVTAAVATAAVGTVFALIPRTPAVSAAINVGSGPRDVAFSPDSRRAYVTNPDLDLLTVIDTNREEVVKTVSVGDSPFNVAVGPDGRHVYTANVDSNTLSVIDAATDAVIKTVAVGAKPQDIVISSNGLRGYTTNTGTDSLGVIDLVTGTLVSEIPIGEALRDIALSNDGSRAYVTNEFGLAIVDLTTNSVVAKIPRTDPLGVAVQPRGEHVFITDGRDDTLSVLDTASGVFATDIPVLSGDLVIGVALSYDGGLAFTTNAHSNNVSVIDTATNSVVATVPVGNFPDGLAVKPDGSQLYVTNNESDYVSVIDLH